MRQWQLQRTHQHVRYLIDVYKLVRVQPHNYTLYGARMATKSWETEHSRKLEANGIVNGSASSVSFFNPSMGVGIIVHGGDLTLFAADPWNVHGTTKENYIVKGVGLFCPVWEDADQVVVLSRVLDWDGDGFRDEVDPQHVDVTLRDMWLQHMVRLGRFVMRKVESVRSLAGSPTTCCATRDTERNRGLLGMRLEFDLTCGVDEA